MAAKTKYVGALVAAAGALVAVGLLMLMTLMVEGRTAGATFPGKNGRIAFVTPTGPRGFGDIYTINPNGSGKFRVTNTKNTDEEWLDYSPDGKKIAYTDYRQGAPGTAIYTISVRGGGKSRVTRGVDPAYSPNGKRIAYVAFDGHDQEIYTIKVGGEGNVQITENRTDDYHPSYSPDGKKIAYVGWDRNYVSDIYTTNVTGGKPFSLTNSGGFEEGEPSYSPNGKKIAYTRGVIGNEGFAKPNSYEIYTINATGGKPFQLTHNKMGAWGPSYSPDGKKIAYVARADRKSDYEIYTINAGGGGGRVQVTHNRTDDSSPSWGSRP